MKSARATGLTGLTGERRMNLGPHGGGVHAAFAWGVLDRLLREDGQRFEGVSGTSAGAMHAVVFAHGMAHAGCR